MMLCFAFWNWINLFCLREQPTVLISGSTIVKEPVCYGIDKVMVFHVILLLKVSLSLKSPSLFYRPQGHFLPKSGFKCHSWLNYSNKLNF